MRWIKWDEDCTWFIDNDKPEETAHRYADGKTLREKLPHQHKLIPEELAQELINARRILVEVLDKIDEYGSQE